MRNFKMLALLTAAVVVFSGNHGAAIQAFLDVRPRQGPLP
jgi:hypothetical protein